MRKISYFLALFLLSTQAFATYIVVLKNGTRYRAKDRPTISGTRATVQLENGTTIQLDANLIDNAKSEEVTRLGGAQVLATPNQTPQPSNRTTQPSLGEITRLRRQQHQQQPPASTSTAPTRSTPPPVTAPSTGTGMLGNDVIAKFITAYENVGFYDAKITPSAPFTLRVELTADNEDQVFKAISATSYVMLRVPSLTGARIELVELFMATVVGGAAGRFHMTQDDAKALDTKQTSLESYYVRKVLF